MTPASVKLERPMPVARTATSTQGLTLSFADAMARHAAGARNAMDWQTFLTWPHSHPHASLPKCLIKATNRINSCITIEKGVFLRFMCVDIPGWCLSHGRWSDLQEVLQCLLLQLTPKVGVLIPVLVIEITKQNWLGNPLQSWQHSSAYLQIASCRNHVVCLETVYSTIKYQFLLLDLIWCCLHSTIILLLAFYTHVMHSQNRSTQAWKRT